MRKITVIAFVALFFLLGLSQSASAETLKIGSTGPEVQVYQTYLEKLGYTGGPVKGVFDMNTAASVRAFQSAYNLGADGLIGPKTKDQITRIVSFMGTTVSPSASVPSYTTPSMVVTPTPVQPNLVTPSVPMPQSYSQTGTTNSGTQCNSSLKLIYTHAWANVDVDSSIDNKSQKLGTFILYPMCDISLDGFSLSLYDDARTSFEEFAMFKGWNTTDDMIGVVAGNNSNSVKVNFAQPLKLKANTPQAITVGGLIRNNKSGKSRVCLIDPIGLKDSNGNTVTLVEGGSHLGQVVCAYPQTIK